MKEFSDTDFGLMLDSEEEKKRNGEEKQRRMGRRLWWIMIRGLFNDAVSSADYIVSNGRMINEIRIEKEVERSGIGLFQSIIPDFVQRDWLNPR